MSSNHTINTLRYSDRLKEQTAYVQKQVNFNKVKNVYNNYNTNNPQPHQQQQKNVNNGNNKIDREKELEEINMNVFSTKDDILNDINFDERINLEDDLLEFKKIENPKNSDISKKTNNAGGEKNNENKMITPEKNMENNSEKIIDEEMEDLIYLKKTVSKDGKFISDDFIKYHKLTDQIIEEEDDIVATHMDVIKQDAKMLTEEGELITKIKGIEDSEENFNMEEYLKRLENILDKKIDIYSGLQGKIDVYKQHIKDEEKMRKEHPQFFVDPADY